MYLESQCEKVMIPWADMPVVIFEVYSSISAASMAGGGGNEVKATIIKACVGLILIVAMAVYAMKKYELLLGSNR